MTKVKKIKTNFKTHQIWWIIAIVIIAITLLAGLILPGLRIPTGDIGGATLYHTPECPHCQDVKAYIQERGTEENIIYKDVSLGRVNQNELYNKMRRCGEDVSGGLAVPVLWSDNQCFVGRDEIINYLGAMVAENTLNQ